MSEKLLEKILAELEDRQQNSSAILKFNLDDPDSSAKFKRAVNADGAYHAVYEIFQEFRKILKYNEDKYSEETLEVIEKLREDCALTLNENGIDLDRDYA